MKVKAIYAETPKVEIVDDRNVKVISKCYIDVVTDEGLLSYVIKPGFITNGRSGPGLIDGFVPHFGNKDMFIAWIVHDMNYYELLSKDLADEVLRQMLILAGMSKFKASIVKFYVKHFGDNAYGLETDSDIEMKKYISLEWKAIKPKVEQTDDNKKR